MRKSQLVLLLLLAVGAAYISLGFKEATITYPAFYKAQLTKFNVEQNALQQLIKHSNTNTSGDVEKIKAKIAAARKELKTMDFWMRYLEPVTYKKINGPLPVEWETEVFEKFEKPYKRIGAGLTLAELYLEEEGFTKDSLLHLIDSSIKASEAYSADSITSQLNTHHHFYLCNRLYLLNLAAIYTTGFECPDTSRIIPELLDMLQATAGIYQSFNQSFSATALGGDYLLLYKNTIDFVKTQPANYSSFDHFTFIKNYINPLYAINQRLIKEYKVYSKSFVDYTLNKNNFSIFNKGLFNGQNPKGIFLRVDDEATLAEIDRVGKLLFYDPILSGNNQRSCNSCHKSTEYFTDTVSTTSLQFDGRSRLPRNSPSLINAKFNHLLMFDGKHISLGNQLKDVMTNPVEMGSDKKEILTKVLSCKEYKTAFTKLLKLTPQETEITLDHLVSAITFYYSKFSNYYALFDEAMNENKPLNALPQKGFNIFMSKAQCATCHFVPHFNGIKPPFVSSEFEVLGVPADKAYSKLSSDKGRYIINPAEETLNAIRTGSIRNAAYTKPYMHNGVFTTLEEVIDFYDTGGGVGHGLKIPNQTLSSDSLHLTASDKEALVAFIASLNEKIEFEKPPVHLPLSSIAALNKRKVGGTY